MAYPNFIIIRAGVVHYLPVTPSELRVAKPQDTRLDVIVNVGEVADLGTRKPRRISFTSHFPVYRDTFVNPSSDIRTPKEWLKLFEEFEDSVLYLIVAEGGIAGEYILHDFGQLNKGGRGGDIEYQVQFIQHQAVSIRSVDLRTRPSINVQNTRTLDLRRNADHPNVYLTQVNDTWASIGQKLGVDPFAIAQLNARTNLFNLNAGQRLRANTRENDSIFRSIIRPDRFEFDQVI